MHLFLSLLLLTLAVAAGQECGQFSEWSYPPPGGQVLDIYGIKFKSQGPNSAAFTIYVHGSFGKRACAKVTKRKLKPSSDGYIYAYCDKYPTDGQYASIGTQGLSVCGDKIEIVAAYKPKPTAPKPKPCQANSRRVGTSCRCNRGYQLVGSACLKACQANSRRVGRSCKCNSGYQLVGSACLKACPRYSTRQGTACKCQSGYKMSGNNCIKAVNTCGGKSYTYCHRGGKDCNGRDIRHVRVGSLRQCQDECNRECRCKSIQQHGSTCWLKWHECSVGELSRSGVGHDYVRRVRGQPCPSSKNTCGGKDYFYCHRGGRDCNGRDIRHVRVGSLRQCQDACDKECRCKSIQQHGSTCWLKWHECSRGQLNRSGVGNDYVKRVRGQRCP